MQVSVTFRHMEAVEEIKQFVLAKVTKIDKYLNHPAEASVVLTREKHRNIAEMTLISHRFSLKGQEETEDMYAAIDLVVDKIERQLIKQKEKIKRHKADPVGALRAVPLEGASAGDEEFERPRIVETKSFSVKPMSLDEATQQMKLTDEEVFVFTNVSSGEVNVLYKTKEGNCGVFVPGKE